MGFEVAFGRLVAGASRQRVAQGCNLAPGGLLGLSMLRLLCVPKLAAAVRQKRTSSYSMGSPQTRYKRGQR